jgi:hypothetical protein
MSGSRRLVEGLLIGGLTGLAVVGMIYLVRAMTRDEAETAALLIQDCRDRIASLSELLEARS